MSGLRKAIFKEIHKQRLLAEEIGNPHAAAQARMLGLFILECLNNRHISRDRFAAELDLEPELAEALLEGLLPASEISQGLLKDIAEVIDHPINLLKTILGGQHRPPAVSNSAS